MEPEHWFLVTFLIHKVTPNFSIYPILLTDLASYTRLDENTLLSSNPPTCILLHTKSALMVPFPNFPRNVYLVFPVKSTVTAKRTRLNRKQIGISPGFAYTEYKVQGATFKSATLDLRCKTIKKTAKSHKRFCSIYVQLSRVQSLEGVSLLKPISLDDINNQPHHELRTDDERFQKLRDITLSSFTNAAVQRRRHMQWELPSSAFVVASDIDPKMPDND